MVKPTFSFAQARIGSIRPYQNNPRQHPKQQVMRLAKSIALLGVTNPLLVNDRLEIIAGHGRYAAAQQLGLTELPVYIVTGLSAADEKALRISDNRLAEGSRWSSELLALEIESLIAIDYDMELTGFDGIEIDKIVTVNGEEADDEPLIAPPPEVPVSRLGDLWEVGDHLILCGDALMPASYSVLLGDDKARMVITDMPFNVKIVDNVSGLGNNKHQEFAMASGEMSPEQFNKFMRSALTLARDSSLDGSLHYYFMDWRSVAELILVGKEVFSELKNVAVWAKPNAGMGAHYRSQHEMVPIFKNGTAPHANNIQLGKLGRNRSNLWTYPGASGFSKSRKTDLQDHPTVKNTRMVADAIRDASNPGDLILDPFGGSGTTMLAAQQIGRRAALIEIEPRFVDVTLRRYQEATGQEPVLLPDRTPVSAIRQQRVQEAVNA